MSNLKNKDAQSLLNDDSLSLPLDHIQRGEARTGIRAFLTGAGIALLGGLAAVASANSADAQQSIFHSPVKAGIVHTCFDGGFAAQSSSGSCYQVPAEVSTSVVGSTISAGPDIQGIVADYPTIEYWVEGGSSIGVFDTGVDFPGNTIDSPSIAGFGFQAIFWDGVAVDRQRRSIRPSPVGGTYASSGFAPGYVEATYYFS